MTITTQSHVTAAADLVVVRLNRAFIPPSFADMVIPSLECTTQDFFLGGPSGFRSKSARHTFYQRDKEGYIGFRAGLVPRAIDGLRGAGIDVQVDDRSHWPVLERAAENLAAIVTDENRNLLNAVVDNPRGQLAVANRHALRRQLVDVLGLFNGRRILIVARNREDRDNLRSDLSASLRRPVSTHHGIPWGKPDRVTVITADFFAGISAVNVDFDVIIFTHPDAVTGTQALETARQLNDELTYCMVPPSYRPDELTQLRLEAICGPVIYDDVASGAAVHVFMVVAPSISTPGKLSPLERKRATIWQNGRRNNLIADIALATANGDIGTLSHRRGFLNQHMDLLTTAPNPGIAILVESTEHGRELQQRLPGWTLQTAIPDRDGALESGTCHRSIITEAFASHGIHADILLRATGTASPLVVRGFPSIGQRRAIVLFDVADEFDAHAIRDTHERIHDYEARGWICGGQIPVRGKSGNTGDNGQPEPARSTEHDAISGRALPDTPIHSESG